MANKKGGEVTQPPVKLKVEKEALTGLQPQSLHRDRSLVANTALGRMGVMVFAVPPKETPVDKPKSKFWDAVSKPIGTDGTDAAMQPGQDLHPVLLRIEPPIDLNKQVWGEHTPVSVTNPYVVMEEETNYALGIVLPPNSFTEWSEPEKRMGTKLSTETYRVRQTIAVLVRFNGDTPITEGVSPTGDREERYLILNDPDEGFDQPSIHALTSRIVMDQSVATGGKNQAEYTELTFGAVADTGTAENAEVDNKGLIDVIVLRATREEIIAREQLEMPYLIDPENTTRKFLPLSPKSYDTIPDSPSRGISAGESFATRKGETKFTAPRIEEVSISSDKVGEPVAIFTFGLVADGGPISMTPAPTDS